ncbi:hypothetical protein HKO22_05420 [Peptoniphilus sp. AGMB00490]|uniref:ABC-2 family transporter protein n=1 Tax=Peptoniphilus faecalis TaxID=2731255 RepID=A0A848RLJ0_9FIRM|nr:ABC-2 transporter permease [Peptoniphilus faecalis]NMW85182.1 hypothetical protein [Peptoniphilus faecalis]
MKTVLYNDFKVIKKIALPMTIFVGAIQAIGFFFTGEVFNRFFIQWAFTMIFIMRTQIIFGDKFNDFEKFITMPVSIEDYSIAKIIKNFVIFFITSIIFWVGLIISNQEVKVSILNIYLNIFIALDFLSLSLSHILYAKLQKGIVILFYGLLVIGFGIATAMGYGAYYDYLIDYKSIFIIASVIIFVLSLWADYKYSTKNIREGQII